MNVRAAHVWKRDGMLREGNEEVCKRCGERWPVYRAWTICPKCGKDFITEARELLTEQEVKR